MEDVEAFALRQARKGDRVPPRVAVDGGDPTGAVVSEAKGLDVVERVDALDVARSPGAGLVERRDVEADAHQAASR